MKNRVVNIRLTPKLIKWLDAKVDGQIFKSRSEVIRNYLRDYLAK
jgi:Arc/MetJ-type ribon-helix-helix transcriptional regulator